MILSLLHPEQLKHWWLLLVLTPVSNYFAKKPFKFSESTRSPNLSAPGLSPRNPSLTSRTLDPSLLSSPPSPHLHHSLPPPLPLPPTTPSPYCLPYLPDLFLPPSGLHPLTMTQRRVGAEIEEEGASTQPAFATSLVVEEHTGSVWEAVYHPRLSSGTRSSRHDGDEKTHDLYPIMQLPTPDLPTNDLLS